MITEMQYVRKMLSLGGYTLVLCDGGRAFTSEDEGILPLWETVKSGEDWENAHAALKTLGKAEALLLLSMKVKGVYAETAAKSALRLLEKNGVQTEFGTCTAKLLNEEKTGLLPTEAAVDATDDPAEAVSLLEEII